MQQCAFGRGTRHSCPRKSLLATIATIARATRAAHRRARGSSSARGGLLGNARLLRTQALLQPLELLLLRRLLAP